MTDEATNQATTRILTNERGEAIAITRAHEAALLELLEAARYQETATAGAQIGADVIMAQNPGLAPHRDEVYAWTARVIGHEAMRAHVLAVYAEHVSEADARALAAFYRTPAGQRTITARPAISQRCMAIGASLAEAHRGELLAAIEAKATGDAS